MAEGENIKTPHLLVYALQHHRWGVLPEGGGLRDQPAGWLDKMAHLWAVYSGIKAYRDAPNAAKWAQAHPDAWEIVASAREQYIKWQVNGSK